MIKKLLFIFFAYLLVSCGGDDDTTSDPNSSANTFDVTIGYVTNHEVGINWTTPTQSIEGTVSYKIVLEGETTLIIIGILRSFFLTMNTQVLFLQ